MKSSRPVFKRQESWRYKRVAENWRRPRGVTSKMRKEESGFPAKVKVGYGTSHSLRGLHPRGLVERLIFRESDLEMLDPKVFILRVSARVGERKRIAIIAKAKDGNFHIANPGKEESRPITQASIAGENATTSEKEPSTAGPVENVEVPEEEEDQADVVEDPE